MKPSQYLLSWFTEIFGNPGRHTVVEPGEELPQSFEGQAPRRAGNFEIYVLDGGTITGRELKEVLPVPGVHHARLITVDEDGPQVQQVLFETDDGRRVCVQRMVISLEDLLDGEAE